MTHGKILFLKMFTQLSALFLVFTFYGFDPGFLFVFAALMTMVTYVLSDYLAFSFLGNWQAAVVDGLIVCVSMLAWLLFTSGIYFSVFAGVVFYGLIVSCAEWFIHAYAIAPVRRGNHKDDEHLQYE
ncbi:DUF2512 family protein [Alteribacter aurantiacus]|uniref:DUF2512 family protein n=1 Tax=Alteribacter aurantiacus TaxID=254410 RepID=UPI0003F76C29|nr:DUF2512 family protein [Alteribacter aurantiacus]